MENPAAWLSLKQVPGIGNLLFKRLIDHFQHPDQVLTAPEKSLTRVEGITVRLAQAIARHRPSEKIQRELDRIEQSGYQLVTLHHPSYPPLLREIPDPPPVLYVHGTLPVHTDSIAVVGSRNATQYGLETTRSLCRELALAGICVVSGMAVGIDTAAHEGALAAGGKTVAVLGSGLNRIYPRENQRLFDQIAETGAVVSELALDTGPDAPHFPARNRIISGMSLGTVVAEAAKRSGSLITARLAGEQNREVFAIPGSIRSFKSSGTHALIKQGAKLVEHVRDILEELPPSQWRSTEPGLTSKPGSQPETDLTEQEARIMGIMEPYPIHIDILARKANLPPAVASGALLTLELKGLINQMPGKWFVLKADSHKK